MSFQHQIDELNSRITRLESESKDKDRLITKIIYSAISSHLLNYTCESEIKELINLLPISNFANLTTNAASSIIMESNVFELLIIHDYDLRNLLGVEHRIIDMIHKGILDPWYTNFERMFRRVIALARVNWSTTKEKDINWNRILMEFNERIAKDQKNHPHEWTNISKQTRDRWEMHAKEMKAEIQLQMRGLYFVDN